MANQKNDHHSPALTRIVINNGIFIPCVAATRVKPDELFTFHIFNRDGAVYHLELTTIKDKNTNVGVTPAAFFVVPGDCAKAIAANGMTPMKLHLHPRNIIGGVPSGFGPSDLSLNTYEFNLELWSAGGSAGGGHLIMTLDPDFDITP